MVEITKNIDPWTIFKELRKIDSDLKAEYGNDADCINKCNVNNLSKIVFITAKGNYIPVYDFTKKKWLNNGLKFLNSDRKYLLNDFINQIEAVRNSNHELIIPMNKSNPFKDYTDHLAATLENKNKDYGDSFSRSVDKFGIIAAVVRLEDKLNRLENLTANGDKEKVKDESLADTALDISGYGLLLYKYLKERERTSKQNGRNKKHENE